MSQRARRRDRMRAQGRRVCFVCRQAAAVDATGQCWGCDVVDAQTRVMSQSDNARSVEAAPNGHPDLVSLGYWDRVQADIDKALLSLPPEDFSVDIPEF